ncbi:hypothetical protein BH11ACT3_BH11ACT3_26540 [soil metagenome]
MSAHSIRTRSLVAVAAITMALAACAAPPAAPEPEPVKLTFASWVFISDEQKAFMDEVTAESDGSVTFTPIENWTEPDGVEKLGDEFAMAKAIATGDIDVGWSSTRSFPALGIAGFRAIEAPFLIQNIAGTNDIVSGPIGEAALAAFDGSGLTGLSVYPGTLRFPLSAGSPLLEPSGWSGKRVLYYSPEADGVQARTVIALGGEPVNEGLHIIDDLKAGAYDAGFDSLGDVAGGGATPSGPFPTSNVIFWPTVLFYVMNTERFESLTPGQRDILLAAAQHAADAEIAAEDDPSIADSVCSTTARFGTSTPDQLASLRDAVEPVYEWLEADAEEAPTLEALTAIAAAHPQADSVAVPEGCSWG